MRRFSLFAMTLLLGLGLTSQPNWAALNDCPGLLDFIRYEPCAGDNYGPILNTAEQTALDQAYLVYSRIDYNTGQGQPVCKVSKLKTDLDAGYGIWAQSSHGSSNGFVAEVYTTFQADTAAFNAYLRNGYVEGVDIYLSTVGPPAYPQGVWCISVTSNWVSRNFYSWKTLVFDGTCYSMVYANWPGARAVLGYPGACPSSGVDWDEYIIFRNLNGKHDLYAQHPETRILSNAIQGTTVNHSGSMNTVLSPTIRDHTIPDSISQRFVAQVRFDCPMDKEYTEPWKVIQATGGIQVYNWAWKDDDKVQFELIGRQPGTPGTVKLISWDPFTTIEGARSRDGFIPIDGDGIGPNRDGDFWTVTTKYVDDQPAGEAAGFAVVREDGLTAKWVGGIEHGTAKYVVEHGPSSVGPFTAVADVTATSANEYAVPITAPENGVFRLREVETDGDVIPLAMDVVRDPFTIPEVWVTITAEDRQRIDQLLATQMRPSSLINGSPVYTIFARPDFLGPAAELRDFHAQWRNVPTEVVLLPDIGGAAGIPAYLDAHLGIRWYLKYGDFTQEVDADGRIWWMDDALWNTMGYGQRPTWPLQPQNNIVPTHFVEDPDSQHVSLAYFDKSYAVDLLDGDRNNDGLLSDGDAFGSRAPVSDTTEAHAFNYKTMRAAFQEPARNIGLWSYAHDAFGNSGAEVLRELQTVQSEFSSWNDCYWLIDQPPTAKWPVQRDAESKQQIESGVSLVIVSSTSSMRYHVGGYLQKTNGFDPQSIAYNGKSTAIFGSCGNGDIGRPDNPVFGTPVIEDLILLPNTPVWFIAGANKGSRTAGNTLIDRETIRRWRANPDVPLVEHLGRALGTVKQQYPAYGTLCDSWAVYADASIALPPPGPPVVSVGEPELTFRMSSWPNPAHGNVQLPFSLSQNGPIDLSIYDPMGRKIATLVSGWRPAGTHQATWNGLTNDGQAVSSGLYFVRLVSSTNRKTQRVVLTR